MSRGRKAIPAELIDPAKAKVSKRKVAERRKVEEDLKVSDRLACPKTLSPTAKKEWRRLMALYRKMGSRILSDLDRQALIMYCEAVSIYTSAQRKWVMLEEKSVSTDRESQAILDKLRTIMTEQTKVITSLLEELCLSPVARSKVGIGIQKKKESNMEAFLRQFSGDGGEGPVGGK